MLHDVPFVSQYQGITDPGWQYRGCGITSVKMMLDFWHSLDAAHRTDDLDSLLSQGLRSGAYLDNIGWRHRGLVDLARLYGYDGYNVDASEKGPMPRTPLSAWELLMRDLEKGPVLASVYRQLDPERGGGHIIIVTGYENGLVHLNDPEEFLAADGRKNMALEGFLPAFKNRFIVLRPTAAWRNRKMAG